MKKLAVVLALAVAPSAHATNGMRVIGFGPVQDSMGGIGVGATLDASSLLSNPAGIVGLGWRLDVGGAFFKPSVSYSATGIAPGIMASDGLTLDSSRGGSPIPAIAYVQPINDKLSFGVGLFGVAGMGVDYPTNLYNGKTYTSYLQGRPHDTATALGVGATVGVQVKPVQAVTFGAAYESKSWFQDFAFTVAERPNPFAPGTTMPGGTDKLTFNQPQSFTIGAAVTPFDILLVAADVQWINWSATMGSGLPQYSTDPQATGALPFNMGWSDQWVVKLGAQVTPLPGLAVRAGYNYGKMPLDPSRAFENLAFPAVAEHHVTAGVGYAVSDRFTLSLAGMYAFDATLAGANADPPPPMGGTGQGIASYTTQMSQLEIDVGLGYKF